MNEPFSFSRQAKVGRQGEQEVIAWLERSGFAVEDVTSDPDWRGRDVDIFVKPPRSEGWLTAEIKTDTHPPAHLFVELTVDGKPGYLYKTRADLLLYYFSGYRKLLWLSPAALAWWVHEHANDLRRIEVKSKRRGSEWVAEGIVVPVSDLREAGLLKEYSLDEVHGEVAA